MLQQWWNTIAVGVPAEAHRRNDSGSPTICRVPTFEAFVDEVAISTYDSGPR